MRRSTGSGGRIEPKNKDVLDTVTFDLLQAVESVIVDQRYQSQDL